MDFFRLVIDKPYSNYPKMKNWYGKIETQKLCYGNAHNMPKRQLLFVERDTNLYFTDVIVNPFFVVSDTARDTIRMYDQTIPFHELVLLEKETGKLQVYHIPFLKMMKCVNVDRSAVHVFEERQELLQRNAIFKYDYKNETDIIARLDLVESLLRRKMTGFSVEPVIIRGV